MYMYKYLITQSRVHIKFGGNAIRGTLIQDPKCSTINADISIYKSKLDRNA